MPRGVQTVGYPEDPAAAANLTFVLGTLDFGLIPENCSLFCANILGAVGSCADCSNVELRALCNEVPRTPPGPEGSNGTG